MDIDMPEKDGYDTAISISRALQKSPFSALFHTYICTCTASSND
jgi:CheY-like chemotaxis protein